MAAYDLATLAQVRAFLELPTADTSRDAIISTLISRASQEINREYEREFAPATASATRTFVFEPAGQGFATVIDLAPYDLRSVSSANLHPEESSPTALTQNTDYLLLPFTSEEGTYTRVQLSANLGVSSTHLQRFGVARVSFTGAWGFASVPDTVAQAAVVTVATWLRRDVAAFGYGLGEPRELMPAPETNLSIPLAARRLLGTYRRNGGSF